MKKGMLSTLLAQFGRDPPLEKVDLSGKTVVVVGANTGLGFEATKHFATMNPGRLILACRSQQKGDVAAEKIRRETGITNLEVWLIDLADFSSVKTFADRFEKEDLRLDILVLNAAVAMFDYNVTKDGWEQTIQVNDISTLYLSLLLAPRLVETGKKYNSRPRIVIVASSVHYWHDFEDRVYDAESSLQLVSSKEYCTPKEMENRYTDSKLLNIFFMRSLANLLKDTPVIVDAVCPGYCYSELRRELTGIRGIIDWIMERIFAWTSEQGSRGPVYAAVGSANDPDRLHGEFIFAGEVTEPSDHVLGESGKKRGDKLWNDLIRELAKVDSRIPVITKQLSSK